MHDRISFVWITCDDLRQREFQSFDHPLRVTHPDWQFSGHDFRLAIRTLLVINFIICLHILQDLHVGLYSALSLHGPDRELRLGEQGFLFDINLGFKCLLRFPVAASLHFTQFSLIRNSLIIVDPFRCSIKILSDLCGRFECHRFE